MLRKYKFKCINFVGEPLPRQAGTCRAVTKQWHLLLKASKESARKPAFFMKSLHFKDTDDALMAAYKNNYEETDEIPFLIVAVSAPGDELTV